MTNIQRQGLTADQKRFALMVVVGVAVIGLLLYLGIYHPDTLNPTYN